uniref:Retrovirus-related Pol polyprotein from transposon TNT 1-94-like beta-barrel domain-containing protein n=1 Tax=Timema douglasi TaxID=61478 RepID=A0A7R8VPV8_TIMDO|nr:unnamed protein product [Timema douglasi]
MAVSNLYPPVQYPVSRGTASLSSLVTWNHEDRFDSPLDLETSEMEGFDTSVDHNFTICLNQERGRMLEGHKLSVAEVEEAEFSLAAITSLEVDYALFTSFYLDSGASEHMICDTYCHLLTNIHNLPSPANIKNAKLVENLKAKKVGDLRASFEMDGKINVIKLGSILIVPALQHNLLTVRRLDSNGCKHITWTYFCDKLRKNFTDTSVIFQDLHVHQHLEIPEKESRGQSHWIQIQRHQVLRFDPGHFQKLSEKQWEYNNVKLSLRTPHERRLTGSVINQHSTMVLTSSSEAGTNTVLVSRDGAESRARPSSGKLRLRDQL